MKVEKLIVTEEKIERKRNPFPAMSNFRRKPLATKIDSDENWSYFDQ